MKQERIIHIELGAEGADVIGWMRSLPSRTINQTVDEILSSESRGKIRQIPHAFSSAKEDAHLSCRFVIREKWALDLVAKIPKGEMKSTLVKIIRKHIRKNREMPPVPIGIHSELFLNKLAEFIAKATDKESEYAGVPNKYSKLCVAYDKAYHGLQDEILACYSSGDETEGDGRLRRLDCDGILQTAFDKVFGTVPKSAAGATFSADENQTPAQSDPSPAKTKHIFVSDEDDWWDEDYYEEDDV